MGNLTQMCSNSQNSNPNRHLNDISPSYQINQFKGVNPNVPYYPDSRYTFLADFLQAHNLQYVDEIYLNAALINDKIKWRRLTEVYPHACLHKNGNFNFQYGQQIKEIGFSNNSFVEAAKQLAKVPEIVSKLFANLEISKLGFYVLQFRMNGNIQKPIQIIIDDYIPVNSNGQYFFRKPKHNLVWIILVEKAWAKIMGSYMNIEYLSSSQLFQQTTGIPSYQLFRPLPNFYLCSHLIAFEPYSSSYLKFTLGQPVELALATCEPVNYMSLQKNQKTSQFKLQLIQQQGEAPEYKLHSAVYQSKSNKSILSLNQKQLLSLATGKYILHIYNRNEEKITSNLVVYASKRVDLHVRKQSSFKTIKHKMIKNYYKQIHNSLQIAHQNSYITLRFIWKYHRGILCLKNNHPYQAKTVQVSILKEFRNQILFEDENQLGMRQKTMQKGEHCFFIFIRKSDQQTGKFYNIQFFTKHKTN